MRVLVTGATGFVGSALVERLVGDGYTVRATHRRDEMPTGPRDVDWRRVPAIGPDTDWRPHLDGVDVVIHLAALAHQIGRAGEGRWSEFETANVLGTRALAEQCRDTPGVKRLVFMSSIGAVRSSSTSPVSEYTEPAPENDYGRSKLLAEEAVKAVLNEGDTDWCVIRPPLVYGPGNPGNMARLMRLVKLPVPLPLGAIVGKRSFIYADNLTDVVCRVIRSDEASRETFMVSDGTPVATTDLIRLLAEESGQSVRLIAIPLPFLKALARMGDLAAAVTGRTVGLDSYSLERLAGSLTVDDRKVRETLDWDPPVGLRDAIRKTVT